MSHRILYRTETPHQRITVAENSAGTLRYLYSSRRGEKQGGIYLEDPFKLYFEYCKVSLVALAFLERDPRDILFVGLGAGSLPRYLGKYYPSARIDIVEVDPEVLDVAERFFFFSETENMKVRIADGRSFITGARGNYDLVFLDAYRVNDIPYHLCTVEFLEEVRGKLSERGVVVSNIVSGEKNRAFDSMVATYSKVYPHVYVFKGVSSYNNVVIAARSAVDRVSLARRAREIQSGKKLDVKLHRLAERPFYSPGSRPGARILTDSPAREIMQ